MMVVFVLVENPGVDLTQIGYLKSGKFVYCFNSGKSLEHSSIALMVVLQINKIRTTPENSGFLFFLVSVQP